MKQTMNKQKEFRYAKALQKDNATSTHFRFNVLAQLANIPARITLYEILRLFKSIRKALREALADTKAFIAQILARHEDEDDGHCFQTSKHFPHITFTSNNMQIKRKHDRPLYFTWYIRSFEVNCIQVNSGSTLSIMPRSMMQYLGIFTHRLSTTQTTIDGFNANCTRPMGKIKLRCQIGDLRSEVTCYIIDAYTSYNLLMG